MTDTLDDEEDPTAETEFDLAYENEIKALPGPIRVIMEKIAFKIKRDGVSIDEACLLVNVDTIWLTDQIERYPVIARALAKKNLEYRVGLMRPLNRKAALDPKMAQYLLELRDPPRRKNAAQGEEDTSGDMLALAISHIQEHGDSSPLVRRESGAAVLITSGAKAAGLMNKVKHVLDTKK